MNLTNIYNISPTIIDTKNVYTDLDLITSYCDNYFEFMLFKFYFVMGIQILIFLIEFMFRFINFKFKERILNIVLYVKSKIVFLYTLISLMITIPYIIDYISIDKLLLIRIATIFNIIIFSIIGYIYYKRYITKNK